MVSPGTALTAGESMAGGNTMSRPNTAQSAPGSEPVNPMPALTELDNPAMDIPVVHDYAPLVHQHGEKG
jgi:hypothetical protein